MSDAAANNLLTSLHRWATWQDENFITEAFSYLLRRLLERDHTVGLDLLNRITDGAVTFSEIDVPTIDISTQVSTAIGTPDVAIRSLHHLVYVEAKVDSGLGYKQLERYLSVLDGRHDVRSKALVLLTRYLPDHPIPGDVAKRIVQKRWYQVGSWLHDALSRGSVNDKVNNVLVEQFVGLLESRNITMDKVGWELPAGVHAFRSLVAMVTEAITGRRITTASSFGRDWAGYNLDEDSQNFFFGMYYERPDMVVFESNRLVIGQDAVERAGGLGAVSNQTVRRATFRWRHELPLDTEDVHFFALGRERQMQVIDQFLDDSLAAAVRLQGMPFKVAGT